jgi:hypothetical protein
MADPSITIGVDWDAVIKTLGSAAVVVAGLTYLAKSGLRWFLDRDVESFKHRGQLQLADFDRRAKEQLESHKEELEREKIEFQALVTAEAEQKDRIRLEIERWANPILGAVMDLERRLDNILNDEGYFALSPVTQENVNPDWSITYDYFLPSTVFLFCQYFCWVRLLEERLRFDLFRGQKEKDLFLKEVRAVSVTLSRFPLTELSGLSGGDTQVFNLQQRALGEALVIGENDDARCLPFAKFLEKWVDPNFKASLAPIISLVDGLNPRNEKRWRRLKMMQKKLQQLRVESDRILSPRLHVAE